MSFDQFNGALSRRRFLQLSSVAAGTAVLAGCSTTGGGSPIYVDETPSDPPLPPPEMMYASVEDEGFVIPAVPFDKIDPQFLRQIVRDPTGEAPGTLVVDTTAHQLFLVRPKGWAIRYGVGLGRAGFEWSGAGVIQWKQKWPKWTPPDEMIARQPELEKFSVRNGGQPGGLKNPLGARAHYIFQNGEDTLYRVHGSPEWKSIGKSVSSGCVRMLNQDVIDLYDRVKNGSPIKVTSAAGSDPVATSGPGMAIDGGLPPDAELVGRIY